MQINAENTVHLPKDLVQYTYKIKLDKETTL